MTGLARYEAARHALAEATRIDEVKDILDQSAAMAEYARRAKDAELVNLATEVRMTAERRLGEMMEAKRTAGLLAKPPGKKIGFSKNPISLSAQGIDKNLADRARKAAAMPAGEYKARIEKAKRLAVAASEGDKEIVKAARCDQIKQKREGEAA